MTRNELLDAKTETTMLMSPLKEEDKDAWNDAFAVEILENRVRTQALSLKLLKQDKKP